MPTSSRTRPERLPATTPAAARHTRIAAPAALLAAALVCACGGAAPNPAPTNAGIGDYRVTEPARVIAADADPGYEQRQMQGIPSLEQAGGRLWAAWYGDRDAPREGPGNFVIVASSDDAGRHWQERFHLRYDDARNRAFDPQLWAAPDGSLWVLYGAAGSGLAFDGIFGAFAAIIDAPGSNNPQVSQSLRLADGVPGKPLLTGAGARQLFPIDYWRNPPPRDRAQAGRNIYVRADLPDGDQNPPVERLGRIPDQPASRATFDETSVAECADGSLYAVIRTLDGLYQSRSQDGGGHWSSPVPFTAFPTPDTRAQVRRSPSGRLALAFNNSRNRERLSLALSDDCGRHWNPPALLDERPGVSYPQLEFLDHGEIAVIYDRNRSSDREVLIAFVDEDAAASGQASNQRAIVSRP